MLRVIGRPVEYIWTEAREALLRARWADGTPGSRIATELGISRKSVFCKAQRLNLPTRNIHGNWTEDQVTQLRAGWAAGNSCSKIADDIGGISRNAVIGKAHRLGLPHREEGRNPKRSALNLRSAREWSEKPNWLPERVFRRRPQRSAKPLFIGPSVADIPADAPVPLNYTLLDLPKNACAWAVNDGKPSYFFCGNPVVVGYSYCGFHLRASLHRRGP